MSFLKIEDHEKRDKIVKKFLELKKRIRQNDLYEKMGETNLQFGSKKVYKPLIDSQDGIKENISKLQDQANKFALTFSNSYPEANREIMITDFKELFPYHEENKGMRLGKGWELFTKFKPDEGIYNEDDLKKYRDIFIQTDAITTKSPYKPKSSRSGKYREIIAPIWRDIKKNDKRKSKGNGVGGRTNIQTIILPSNPDALIEMLELRIAAWKAGNTGARNETVAICDELLRQGVINSAHYKAIQNNL
ncbi:uncharacterized protein LOC136078536 [Hydra vulgaris]|uniref:Uncharacterized protein LOC136078536 n=1 Tax=Hydra vulgaris TaxID=6087 RepID=A0ABM4BMS8_HYDVU